MYVLKIGAVLITSVALCIFIIAKCKSKQSEDMTSKRPYAFSLLRDGGSFFNDDEREVEIFKRPLVKGELSNMQYFYLMLMNRLQCLIYQSCFRLQRRYN